MPEAARPTGDQMATNDMANAFIDVTTQSTEHQTPSRYAGGEPECAPSSHTSLSYDWLFKGTNWPAAGASSRPQRRQMMVVMPEWKLKAR